MPPPTSGIDGITINNLGSKLQELGDKITTLANDQYSPAVSKVQALIDGTGTLIALYLTVWIIIEGYKMAFGKNGNFKDFLWNAGLKSAFILLAVNATFWTELVWTTFSEAREYVVDAGFDIFEHLKIYADTTAVIFDRIGTNIANFSSSLWTKGDALMWLIILFLCFVGLFIGLFSLFRILIINTISFLILMTLSPVAFYFLIFNITKQSFGNWFNAVLSNIITLVCLGLFVTLAMGIILNFVLDIGDIAAIPTTIMTIDVPSIFGSDVVVEFYPIPYSVCIYMILSGIILNVFTSMAASIAQSITSVSIESIANTAAGRAMGIGGSVVGGMAGATILGGRLAQSAGSGYLDAARGIGSAGSKAIGYIGSKFKGK